MRAVRLQSMISVLIEVRNITDKLSPQRVLAVKLLLMLNDGSKSNSDIDLYAAGTCIDRLQAMVYTPWGRVSYVYTS